MTAPVSAAAAREAAIDRTGWGNPITLWQPRNACFWVFLGALGYGLWCLVGTVNSEIRLYAPALIVSSIIFALYGTLFWWFTTRIDRFSRQPVALKVAAFVWGGFVTPWTIAISGNTALMGLYGKAYGQDFVLNWGAGVTAPIFEELGKGAAVVLLMFLAPQVVRTAYDGFILGAFAGLGFEILEDILYALNSAPEQFGSHPLRSSLSTVGVRLLTGFSSHILYSAIAGAGLVYLIGTEAQPRRPGRGLALMLTAMLLHGVWNANLGISGGRSPLIQILLIVEMLLALAVVVAVHHVIVRPEREALRGVMAPEVEAGVITGAESDALTGGRRERRAYHRTAQGRAEQKLRRHRLEAAYDLADQLAASGGADTERVRFTRAELARFDSGPGSST